MIASYNNYRHQIGECDIALSQENVENEAHQVASTIVRLRFQGMLGDKSLPLASAPSAAAMDRKFLRLLQAYSVNGKDFLVFLPDGTTRSNLTLKSATAIGGVRVIRPPSIDGLRNAQYTTYLPYTVELEAEYPSAQAGLLLTDFQESITREGGRPIQVWQKPLVGQPILQQVRQRDTFRVRQVGTAVGFLAYPDIRTVAPELWPAFRMDSREPVKHSPRKRGNTYTHFRIDWDREYEANRPLLGGPNLWS